MQFRVDRPTKGLSVELDYSDCGIERINVLDFIASSDRTRVAYSPDGVPGKLVTVDFDGWLFPRSGVAFVWSLQTSENSPSNHMGSNHPHYTRYQVVVNTTIGL